MFWKNLCPVKVRAAATQRPSVAAHPARAPCNRALPATLLQEYQPPSGELLKLIEARWKSLDNFKTAFNAAAAGVQVRALRVQAGVPRCGGARTQALSCMRSQGRPHLMPSPPVVPGLRLGLAGPGQGHGRPGHCDHGQPGPLQHHGARQCTAATLVTNCCLCTALAAIIGAIHPGACWFRPSSSARASLLAGQGPPARHRRVGARMWVCYGRCLARVRVRGMPSCTRTHARVYTCAPARV